MSYIELKNVTKSYKDRKIFEDISLNLEKGKFISFIGSYGCGKTTILKMIAGIEGVNSGKILVNNSSPEILKKDLKIGFAFQDPMLLPWRTVVDNIRLPLEIQNKKENSSERALKLLNLVELGEKKDSYPNELSGGMQRIVSILRAIIFEPAVLLLDEPLSSIDEINRDELHEKLIKIHKQNKQTTILVTHSIHEAVYLSDEIYILGGNPTRIIKKIEPKNPRKIKSKFSTDTINQVAKIREELRKAVNNA